MFAVTSTGPLLGLDAFLKSKEYSVDLNKMGPVPEKELVYLTFKIRFHGTFTGRKQVPKEFVNQIKSLPEFKKQIEEIVRKEVEQAEQEFRFYFSSQPAADNRVRVKMYPSLKQQVEEKKVPFWASNLAYVDVPEAEYSRAIIQFRSGTLQLDVALINDTNYIMEHIKKVLDYTAASNSVDDFNFYEY